MSKEAMTLALEALERIGMKDWVERKEDAITSLRQAIADAELVAAIDISKERVEKTPQNVHEQEQGEPVADPFADIHDKRIGELTAEQQDRAVEFWLREQKGWLPMSQREHVEALLRVIDKLRTTPQPSQKPLTEEVLKDALRATGFLTQRQAWLAAEVVMELLDAHGIKGVA